jgi:DNA-binding winged helix-turn-helix (wHTH) protein/tetratricopeptide (TPR) repeat protein
MVFEFDDFELNEPLFELRRRGLRASVQPKVLKLLLCLVRHRDRVVGKEELIRLLWPTESVGETSLTRAVRGARIALGDSGESQRAIKTVRGRGYRFALSAHERQTQLPDTVSGSGAGDATNTATSTSLFPSLPRSGPGAGGATTTAASLFPSSAEVFVGREGAIQMLEAGLSAARLGCGRMVLLVGEPGIGKTRLVQHFAARARQMGAVPLLGRCVEGEGAPAYWPWLGIVRQYIETRDREHVRALMGAGGDDIAQALPELNRWLPGLAAPPTISSTQARFRFYESMVAFLRHAAAEQPLVLMFDDLQRADQPTVRLLQFLAGELQDMHLLVVGTHRPMDAMPRRVVGDMLSELAQRDPSQCLQLEGLSRIEIASYLERMLVTPAPGSLVEALHEQTAGNPLFLSQIVSVSRAAGAVPPPTGWDLRQVSRGRGLQEAIRRRLETLSTPCRTVLSAAAVIGHEFSMGVLAAVTDTPSDELLRLLGEAISAGVVSASTAVLGRYRFVHGLLPDALYGRLSALEMARLHERVGLALEKLSGADVEPQLAELAHHFLLAAPVGDIDKAVDYSLRAADRAVAQLAHEEAAMHFDRALQALALRPADEARVMGTLAGKGEALFAASDLEGSRAAFERSAAIARKIGSAEGLARVACGIAMPRETARVDEGRIGVLEEAIRTLPADQALYPVLIAYLAKALLYAGQLERRVALAREAVIRARPLRTARPLVFGQVLRIAHAALAEPEHSSERLRMNEELIALALAEHNDELLLAGHFSDVQDFLELGDMKSVDAAMRAMTTLAERVRQPHYRMFGEVFKAMRALNDGRFAEAESHAREALAQGKRMDPDSAYHVYCIHMNGILSLQGRWEEQETLVRDISSRYPALGGWRSTLGFAEARLGMRRQARQRFERLMAGLAAAIRREPFVLGLLCPLADLCSEVGDAEHAARLYQALSPYARYHGILPSGISTHGPVARHMGNLAVRMGNHELAAQHFEAALATSDGGCRSYLALALHSYAGLFASTGDPSHRTRARELAERALSESRAMGMAALAKDSQALATDLVARPAGAGHRPQTGRVLS